jgi:hypothetical protein
MHGKEKLGYFCSTPQIELVWHYGDELFLTVVELNLLTWDWVKRIAEGSREVGDKEMGFFFV